MMLCLYAYPIIIAKDIDALVSMDFDLPTEGGLEENSCDPMYFYTT
jgi:hypothetical protein